MLDLWDRRDARVRTFSKGMKQRLTIARALINDPPVLFLDEPTANLDPEGAKTVRDFLLQLKAEKRTILLNTHQLAEAERVCDRVGIMHTRLIAVGTPDGLRGGRVASTPRRSSSRSSPTPSSRAARTRERADVTVSGNTITVPVDKPERDNPELVKAIVAAGGEIQFVSGIVPTLEETYLKLLGDEKNEKHKTRGNDDELAERGDHRPQGPDDHDDKAQPADRPGGAPAWPGGPFLADHRARQHSRGPLPKTLNAFLFFFMIYTGALPATLASYSMVGEKVERSLEPLLATPASDGEILLGKGLAALVPPLVAMWAGMVILMALCDAATRATLGYLYFPNWMAALTVFGVAPLLAGMAVAFSVLMSARVSEVRTAQQLGALAAIPGVVLYIGLVTGAFSLDLASLAVLCGVLAAVNVGLALAARATFHREEILTRWA